MVDEQKILVVSDDPTRLRSLLSILEAHQFQARGAASGGEAITQYENWAAELIISDYHLTGLQDMQLVELIRRMNQRARFILVLKRGEDLEFRQITPNRIVAYLREEFTEEEVVENVQRGFGLAEDFYNRRRASRYKLAIDTHCILINPFTNMESRPIVGLIRDVSRTGLSMLVRQVLPVPSMLKLVVVLPHTHRSITMFAKSVSCTLTQINNVYRLGAKFVGMLPVELEEAISEWNIDHPDSGDTDIFMGKSFKLALQEWLTTHQEDLAEALRDPKTPPPLLAEEVVAPQADPEDSDHRS